MEKDELAQIEDGTVTEIRGALSRYVAFVTLVGKTSRVKLSNARVVQALRTSAKELAEDPVSFTQEELKQAVEHLAFDIHYFRVYDRLLKESRPIPNPFFQAMLYSVLLHFRVLVDFFYKEPQQDDCTVVHFNILPAFAESFPKLARPKELWRVSQDLSKRLVHFTATRWRLSAPDMNHYRRHFDPVSDLIHKFQAALPPDVRANLDARLLFWEQQARPLT